MDRSLKPNCDYCTRIDRPKKAGVGLCGECPYNKTFVPHFEAHPAAIAALNAIEPDAGTPDPKN